MKEGLLFVTNAIILYSLFFFINFDHIQHLNESWSLDLKYQMAKPAPQVDGAGAAFAVSTGAGVYSTQQPQEQLSQLSHS